MNEYEFTLKFTLHDDPDAYVDKLGSEGCDDALVGIGQNGRIALSFTREASSAFEAISSAVADVMRAIPDAKLVEATPDLVGLTDVAEILGFSRQNMRKLMLAGGAAFPAPVHEGSSAIWHLSQVLRWLRDQRKIYQIQDTLLEVAEINRRFNSVKEVAEIDSAMQRSIRALIAGSENLSDRN